MTRFKHGLFFCEGCSSLYISFSDYVEPNWKIVVVIKWLILYFSGHLIVFLKMFLKCSWIAFEFFERIEWSPCLTCIGWSTTNRAKTWKKNLGPTSGQVGQNRTQNQVYGSLVFLKIPSDDSLEHCLTTASSKTYEKKIGGPKFGPKLGLMPFFQGCIIRFPWYCARSQLGTMSNI